MSKKIIIIDDDDKLQVLLKEYFGGYNFNIISLSSGDGMLDLIKNENPDIIILDIMLPDKDGLELLKDIRSQYNIPVLMLTAKGDEEDKIVGLELGADDYLSKPFNPRELLARIKAVLRRSEIRVKVNNSSDKKEFIEAGGLKLISSSMTLEKDNNHVDLSRTECKILEVLMKNSGQIITRDELMNFARGRDFIAFERSIDVHVSKLRAKVESVSGLREQIKTIWGTGYMFVDNS